jgi:hypothetical protein
MRRLVDETPEQEIWMGSPAEPSQPSPTAAPTVMEGEAPSPDQAKEGQDVPNPTATDSPPEPVLPRATPITFGDTLRASGRIAPNRLLTLLVGVLWTTVVLAGAGLLTWQLAGPAGQDPTLPGLRVAVNTLADQQPVLLAGMALGAIGLGALGLGRQLRWVARQAAAGIVYGASPSRSVPFFPGPLWGPGVGSILLATAGIDLLLVAGALFPLAWEDQCLSAEVLGLGGLGAALLTLGSLGLGAEAARRGREGSHRGTLDILLGTGVETLVTAAANLGLAGVRFGILLGMVGLTWYLTCESISWWGGENIHWVRWGLDRELWPESEGGLYQVASWITGVWFFLIVGCAFMYPISHVLSWGAAAYLRASQKAEDAPKILLALSEDERACLIGQKRKRADQRQKARAWRAQLGKRLRRPSAAVSPAATTDPSDPLPAVPPGAPLPP